MQAILFALVSYIGWGAGDLFAAISGRKIGSLSATFWFLLLAVLIFLPFGILFKEQASHITPKIILLVFTLSTIGNIGLITFYEALRVGNPTLVGTVSSSFVGITVLLSIIFLNEIITLPQGLAILIILLGLIVASLDVTKIKKQELFSNKGILYALISALTWGVYWTFIKIPVLEIGWYWTSILAYCSFPTIWLLMVFKKQKLAGFKDKKSLLSALGNAFLTGIGSFSFNFAIGNGLTAIVAPIAGSYPTLFAVLSYFFFKEPIKKNEVIGIVATLIGIVLLAFLSS